MNNVVHAKRTTTKTTAAAPTNSFKQSVAATQLSTTEIGWMRSIDSVRLCGTDFSSGLLQIMPCKPSASPTYLCLANWTLLMPSALHMTGSVWNYPSDPIWKTKRPNLLPHFHALEQVIKLGWHYLSNAACLMPPRLCYACFVVTGITITCYILSHFWRKPALDK